MPQPKTDIVAVTPSQCHLMSLQGLTLKDIVQPMETVKVYEDESHLIRKLYRCPRCGQLYFYEFLEEVDWKGGNDPQWRTMVPVAGQAGADALNALPSAALRGYPAILMDFPKEADAPQPPRWVNLNT